MIFTLDLQKKLISSLFLKFKINPDPKTNWVVGSNYYEPSYCLHTYSRATNGPGKILSYTTQSNTEKLFDSKLNENSFNALSKTVDPDKPNRSFCFKIFQMRFFFGEYFKEKTKISLNKLKDTLKKP